LLLAAEPPGLEIDHLIEWGEHPIADAPWHSLFFLYETQKNLPGAKPKTGQRITANCGCGLKPKRN
jgi:hypothetical protein